MQISHADSSDDDNIMLESAFMDQCMICKKRDDGTRPERWVGCDCGRWVRRDCSYIDFSNMTEMEVLAFNSECENCEYM